MEAESFRGNSKCECLRDGGLPGHCSPLFKSSELILSPAVLGASEAWSVAEWPAGRCGQRIMSAMSDDSGAGLEHRKAHKSASVGGAES